MGIHGRQFFDAYTSLPERKGVRVNGRLISPSFPLEFHRNYEIEPLNDTEADCTFSVDDSGAVFLETALIAGRSFPSHEFEAWMGSAEVERITDQAQDWWDDIGESQAYQDAADEYGDYLRDQRMDD
ncbi:hypothetical protein D2T31_11915 [Sinirhodobacter populi]|uniref:Uncharacterized protein n=1 Tax=Paenirhodobacter populi TaxID=2306993 RepID=A0A443K804_9RHOB|nr:hypothetical protein [Sinirhodobacter populi]RWR28813.1 hypothetical protein D2T31_11915 [Sinirhodobacter populi]